MTMWLPELSRKGPLAVEILRVLENDIETGRLAPGSKLPTHRELADHLRVAIGTITRVYALAKQRGIVTGTTGRGTFVAEPLGLSSSADLNLSQNMVMRDTRDPAIRAFLAAFGDPSVVGPLLDTDQSAAGPESQRDVAATWMARPGFQPKAADVVITCGVQHGMHVVLSNVTKPGDIVMTEHVTYAGIKAITALLQLQLRGLNTDDEGIDPQAFEDACRSGGKILYVTPTLQNPTSATMSDRRRREIAATVARYGVTVLEDDVYGFLAPDAPRPLAAYAPEHSFYLIGTSKSLAPGLRVGYTVCPAGMQPRIANTVRATIWEAAPLMGELVTKWIKDGTAERIIRYKRAEVKARHDLASALLGPGSPLSPHRWIPLPEPWQPEEFTQECRRRGVIISPGAAFAMNRDRIPIAVRICLGSVANREQLRRGLEVVADLLRNGPATQFAVT